MADSSGYNVGDKIQIANGGTPIESIGLADKNSTNQAMTFTVVAKPSGTSMTIYPKPIALDDPALTTLEQAYANVIRVFSTRQRLTGQYRRISQDQHFLGQGLH